MGRLNLVKPIFSLAFAGLVLIASAGAQTPDTVPEMGPHHPPMERALGPGMRGEHGRWWNDTQTAEKYKLTDSQRKSMDDIYQQSRAGLVDLHATLQKEEIAMEPLMKADQPDETKILAQIDRVAQARAELEKANARMLLGIRRQLTPEQWKQIMADRAARAEAGPNGQPGPGMRHWQRPGPDAAAPPPPPGQDE